LLDPHLRGPLSRPAITAAVPAPALDAGATRIGHPEALMSGWPVPIRETVDRLAPAAANQKYCPPVVGPS
jgi:hypothetical protein